VAIDGEVFDPRFHTYREDAELAFRLRERGWEVLYEPAAVAEHRRRVLPERRASLPVRANLNSLRTATCCASTTRPPATSCARWCPPELATSPRSPGCSPASARRCPPTPGSGGTGGSWSRGGGDPARRRVPPAEIDRWFRVRGRAAVTPHGWRGVGRPGGDRRQPGHPRRYGGYETLAEELAVRLVERGWRVTVACRSHSTPRHLVAHRGVDLVVLPTLPTKYLDTPVHTLL
jgi:hypothetical protein